MFRRTLPALLALPLLCAPPVRAATAAAPASGVAPATAASDLLGLLSEEDYEAQRPRLLRTLPAGDGACAFLGALAAERSARVREHAVRLLADVGCSTFEAYGPFLDDPSPWVVEAILGAIERYLIGASVPYLLDRLEDPRRILEGDSARTLGDTAHRVLRVVTCQSFHFDRAAPPAARAEARRRFEAWYAAARGAPREAWVREGISRARDYLGLPGSPWRVEGLRLLLLIGQAAEAELRAALWREPEDLQVGVVCRSDDPPRVTEALECVLLVQNASRRRVALAASPEGPRVTLVPIAPQGSPPPAGPRAGAGAAIRPGGPGDARSPAPARPAPPGRIADAIIDLGPGEILERPFKAGPVGAAGRYEARAVLEDLAAALVPAPPIEGRTVVRFEQ